MFAIMYALFLGFGFAIGAACFEKLTHTKVFGAEDYSCTLSHHPAGPWYQRTPSQFWGELFPPPPLNPNHVDSAKLTST